MHLPSKVAAVVCQGCLVSAFAAVLGAGLRCPAGSCHRGRQEGDAWELQNVLQQRGTQIGSMLVKIILSKTLLPGNASKLHLVRKHLRLVLKMHVATKVPK